MINVFFLYRIYSNDSFSCCVCIFWKWDGILNPFGMILHFAPWWSWDNRGNPSHRRNLQKRGTKIGELLIERSKDGNLDPHQDNPQLEVEVFNRALFQEWPLDKVLCLLRLLGVLFRGAVGRATITEDGQLEELWNSHLKVGHLFLGGWFQWWYYYFHYYISSLFTVIHIIRGMLLNPCKSGEINHHLNRSGPSWTFMIHCYRCFKIDSNTVPLTTNKNPAGRWSFGIHYLIDQLEDGTNSVIQELWNMAKRRFDPFEIGRGTWRFTMSVQDSRSLLEFKPVFYCFTTDPWLLANNNDFL